MSAQSPRLRVLLTNDDGPPGRESPYIFGLYKHLTNDLGWDVKVVIPSSQKSWIGKAYHIKEIIKGRFYYPTDPDGNGETSEQPRPLKDGEVAEWVLLDGTPATCSNIAIHNLYHGEIDLLISGPNLGRNSSAAFALSSGTIGAALSSSLSKIRSIALSYGTVVHPTPREWHDPAHRLSARIIAHLVANWGADPGGLRASREVDLYNINVPMVADLLAPAGLTVAWTRMWRNSYGRLFKAEVPRARQTADRAVASAGPDSDLEEVEQAGPLDKTAGPRDVGALVYRFAPDMTELINPTRGSVPVGSDGWAIAQGWVSVTPLRASFAEPDVEWDTPDTAGEAEKVWKMKL